jgi:hypothetical protein
MWNCWPGCLEKCVCLQVSPCIPPFQYYIPLFIHIYSFESMSWEPTCARCCSRCWVFSNVQNSLPPKRWHFDSSLCGCVSKTFPLGLVLEMGSLWDGGNIKKIEIPWSPKSNCIAESLSFVTQSWLAHGPSMSLRPFENSLLWHGIHAEECTAQWSCKNCNPHRARNNL